MRIVIKIRQFLNLSWQGFVCLFLTLVPTALSLQADVLDNWTTNQVSANFYGLDSIAYSNARYVAAGSFSDFSAIISSEDGLHWFLRVDSRTNGNLAWDISLSVANSRFIAVSAWGGTAVSTNGTNWSISSVPQPLGGFDPLHLYGSTYGAGKYVAVGQADLSPSIYNIAASTNGLDWTLYSSHPTDARTIVDVAYGGFGISTRFLAIVPNDGFIYSSSTGTSWFRGSIPGGATISFVNGRFIIPYVAGTNLISSLGTSWDAKATGITNLLGKVTFANGLYMARAGNSLATSTDGTNWTQYAPPAPGVSLACDGTHLLTVSSSVSCCLRDGFVYTSDALVGIRMTNTPPQQVVLSGLVGRFYQIDYAESLADSANNWQTNAPFQLPNNPFVWTDSTATNSQRFYRGVLLP